MQQRNPKFRHRGLDSEQKERTNRFKPEYLQSPPPNTPRMRKTRSHQSSGPWVVHAAKRAVNVAMQKRYPTIRHSRLDNEQKELSNRFQPEYLQPPPSTPRKRTTTSHRSRIAGELHGAKRTVDVALQQRNPTFRHKKTESEQKELTNSFQTEYLQPPPAKTPRKRMTRSHRSSKRWK